MMTVINNKAIIVKFAPSLELALAEKLGSREGDAFRYCTKVRLAHSNQSLSKKKATAGTSKRFKARKDCQELTSSTTRL